MFHLKHAVSKGENLAQKLKIIKAIEKYLRAYILL